MKSKLNQIVSPLNRCPIRQEPLLDLENEPIEEEEEEEEKEEQDLSTQFLQAEESHLVDLQDHLERYCKVFPVFGFKSTK